MTGTDFNLVAAIFFIPYLIFGEWPRNSCHGLLTKLHVRFLEIPSNTLLLRFSRPSYYLGIIVTAWGLVMTFTGFVQNMAGLAACRALLGVFEYG